MSQVLRGTSQGLEEAEKKDQKEDCEESERVFRKIEQSDHYGGIVP